MIQGAGLIPNSDCDVIYVHVERTYAFMQFETLG